MLLRKPRKSKVIRAHNFGGARFVLISGCNHGFPL